MKKLLAMIVFLCALPVMAQYAALPVQSCVNGGGQALTSGMKSTNYQEVVIPSCTVTIYLTGTTTKATLYTNGTGTPLANPFTASNKGQFVAYAAVNQGYDVVLSGGVSPNTYATPYTITGVYPSQNVSVTIGCAVSVLGVCQIAGGGTGATTAEGANLNITGVTQTGALGTNTQVSAFPGALNGENICGSSGWASIPLACIADAASNGRTAFFPDGTYQFALNSVLPNNTHIRCASQASILEAVNNAQGDLFTDNSATINATIDNCTLSRNGTGVLLPSEGQNPRYTLHITGVGTTITLNNDLLTNSGWNLGTVSTEGWPGVITLVNESGTVTANASQIVSQARGIYQPDASQYQYTYWQGGTILTHHKATSLHAGEIHVTGPVTCTMTNSDATPGGDTDACLSNYAGTLYMTGDVAMYGWGPVVYATSTAQVYITGNGSNSYNYGILSQGSGKVSWVGNLKSLGIGIQNTGSGQVYFKGTLTTLAGGPSGSQAIGVYATAGTTRVRGEIIAAAQTIYSAGASGAAPAILMDGPMQSGGSYDVAYIDGGTIQLSGSMNPGQSGVYFYGTTATTLDAQHLAISGGVIPAVRFGSNVNAYAVLQDVRMSNTGSYCMSSSVSVNPVDIAGAYCDSGLTVQSNITLRKFGSQAPLTNLVSGPGSGATIGHLAVMGNTAGTSITDSGYSEASFATSAQGTKADNALPANGATSTGSGAANVVTFPGTMTAVTTQTAANFSQGAMLTSVAPNPELTLSSTPVFGTGTTSREYLIYAHDRRIRQSGTLRRVKLYTPSLTNMTAIYFEVWRLASTTWTLIGRTENVLSQLGTSGLNTVTFASPVQNAQAGDFLGVYAVGNGANVFAGTTIGVGTVLYYTTDQPAQTTGYVWTGAIPFNYSLDAEADMYSPDAVMIGDSITAGHSVNWSFLETTDTNATAYPGTVGQMTGWSYQNMGIGGQTCVQVQSRFSVDAVNLAPKIIYLMCGVNDIAGGTSQSATMAAVTSMLSAAQAAGIKVVHFAIAPWTNGTNVQMATRDSYNAQFAALDATYGAITVNLDSTLGQNRPSGPVGNLWDILTAYSDGSGVHFNTAGYTALGTQAYSALASTGAYNATAVASLTGFQDTSTETPGPCNALTRGSIRAVKGVSGTGGDLSYVCEMTNSTGPVYTWMQRAEYMVVPPSYAESGVNASITSLTALQQETSTNASATYDAAPLGAEVLSASGWTSTNWAGSWAGGWTHTAGNTSALSSSASIANGTLYQVVVTVSGRTAGTITVSVGGYSVLTSTGGALGSNATTSQGISTSSTGSLTVTPTSTFDGTIVLSIKQIGTSLAAYTSKDSSAAISFQRRVSSASLYNTFEGKDAGQYCTTGNYNTAFGYQSAFYLTSGYNNTFMGFQSGLGTLGGYSNAAVGYSALSSNTWGYFNSSFGQSAGAGNTIGYGNVYEGYRAGRYLSDGSTANATGTNSVYVGRESKSGAASSTNEIVIGYSAVGGGSNTSTIGSSSTTATFIGGVTIPITLYSAAGTALPSCASATKGGEAVVSDSSTLTPGSAYTSGGTYTVRVQCTYNTSGTVYAWQTM